MLFLRIKCEIEIDYYLSIASSFIFFMQQYPLDLNWSAYQSFLCRQNTYVNLTCIKHLSSKIFSCFKKLSDCISLRLSCEDDDNMTMILLCFFYNINSKSSGKKMEEKEKAAYHILWQHPVNFSKRKSLNFLRLRTANGKTLLVLCVHQNTSYTFATWSSVFIKPHFHSLTLVSLSKT